MSGNHEPLQDGSAVFASIVIPSFNAGDLIVQTLRSCLMIHGVDLEIIVVDDGSTDGTPEAIEKHFSVVRLHRLSHSSGSGSVARNVGLSLAKGVYVKFLDHDDLIQPRGFKNECSEAMRSNADIIMGSWGVAKIDQAGRFKSSTIKVIRPPHPERLKEAILMGESVPYTGAALYKKSYLVDDGWDPTIRLIDDFDWFARMAFKGGEVRRVETISYYWRQHERSLQGASESTGSIYREIMAERYRVFRKLEDSIRDRQPISVPLCRLLARRYYGFMRWCAREDMSECLALQQRIYALDPCFVVDSSCESSLLFLWLVGAIGLAPSLRLYRWSVRLLRR